MKKTTSIFMAFAFFSILKVQSIDFKVGGDKGWTIPPSNRTDLYNHWASNNRFNINDALRFEYKKDSVLVVTKEEHEKCRSSHPIFFSNNGDTSFELDRSGYFYFISGVTGHCERGLKMIIKVIEPQNHVPQSANQTSSTTSTGSGTAATSTQALVILVSMFMVFFV